MPQVITVEGVSNAEFIDRHAAPGRVGLIGGTTLVDRLIRRVQKTGEPESRGSAWSHAFLFEGQRADDCQWVIESDLQFHRRHIQLGVQENRASKYHDEKTYADIAIIDFGLEDGQIRRVLGQGLEFVANHTRYSLRELVGAWLALRHPALRPRENLLAQERSLFCSALVRQVFLKVGIDLLPGIDSKHTAPEDFLHTSLDHTLWVMRRTESNPAKAIGARLRSGARQIRIAAGVRVAERRSAQ
jgi:hypothetical protein